MASRLEVAAELVITIDGSTILLRGNGNRLETGLPNMHTALLVKKSLNKSLGTVHTWLSSNQLTMDLRLHDSNIGRIGYGARSTLMGWLAGCSSLELHFFRIAWAMAKSFLRPERV